MSMEEQYKSFIEENRDSLRMALSHGNFDETMKVMFSAGYDRGVEDLMSVIDMFVDSAQEVKHGED